MPPPPPLVWSPTFIAARPPLMPVTLSVLPAPTENSALLLFWLTAKVGVVMVLVPAPAAVVTVPTNMFMSPLRDPPELPTRNDVEAVIVLLTGSISSPPPLPPLLAVVPTETVPTLTLKLDACEASSLPLA